MIDAGNADRTLPGSFGATAGTVPHALAAAPDAAPELVGAPADDDELLEHAASANDPPTASIKTRVLNRMLPRCLIAPLPWLH